MDKFDYSSLNFENIEPIYIASPIADDFEKQRHIEELSKVEAESKATIVAGAQANIEQKNCWKIN